MRMPDSVDVKLVQLLGQSARQSSKSLAEQLHLSSATVRRRLRKLVQSGTLNIVGIVDPTKFGLPLAAMVALNVAHDKLEAAVETLANRPEIRWVSTTTGRFDIMALGRFNSTDNLSDFLLNHLAGIEGVRDTETFICLDLRKGRYVPFT